MDAYIDNLKLISYTPQVSGAPDPTAGGSANEQMAWWLDESNLHENIHKILVKFCVPSPIVFR